MKRKKIKESLQKENSNAPLKTLALAENLHATTSTPRRPANHTVNSGPVLLKQSVISDTQKERVLILSAKVTVLEVKSVDSSIHLNFPDKIIH